MALPPRAAPHHPPTTTVRENQFGDPDAIPVEHDHPGVPKPRRPWTSEDSSSERGGAIMTPSPCLPARPSRGWTGGPPHPPGPGAGPRRGPGGAHPSLARPSGLRDLERFDAWLHRLTVNACLDIARHRRRRVDRGGARPDRRAHGRRPRRGGRRSRDRRRRDAPPGSSRAGRSSSCTTSSGCR